jgi:hypothetical protein
MKKFNRRINTIQPKYVIGLALIAFVLFVVGGVILAIGLSQNKNEKNQGKVNNTKYLRYSYIFLITDNCSPKLTVYLAASQTTIVNWTETLNDADSTDYNNAVDIIKRAVSILFYFIIPILIVHKNTFIYLQMFNAFDNSTNTQLTPNTIIINSIRLKQL